MATNGIPGILPVSEQCFMAYIRRLADRYNVLSVVGIHGITPITAVSYLTPDLRATIQWQNGRNRGC